LTQGWNIVSDNGRRGPDGEAQQHGRRSLNDEQHQGYRRRPQEFRICKSLSKAQLIQVKDQPHVVWSQHYDYPSKDILNVEDEVAKAVAREIRVRLTSKQKAELTQLTPVSPEAFDAYMQGNYYSERDSDKDTKMAAKYFERATQLDPSYALAWVGLSWAQSGKPSQVLFPRRRVIGLRVKQISER
jgi:hypothetical protein